MKWYAARGSRGAGRALVTDDCLLVVEQVLNGLQFGVMLFLMAAGLTLVFGIMNLVNLAHGSLYMVGAYLAAAASAGPARSCWRRARRCRPRWLVGMLVEVLALRTLYERDHLDQVLATFGLILFFNEAGAPSSGAAPRCSPRCRRRWPATSRCSPACATRPTARSSSWSAWPSRVLSDVVDAHAARHADPRGRQQPHDGGRARRQHPRCSTRWSSASARRWPASPA